MFSIIDGPPFATGSPHYGHILTGAIKDAFARYNECPQYFNWDTHGLPIEQAVDPNPPDTFNQRCRELVEKNISSWDVIIRKMNRRVLPGIKTMDRDFMQTVWNVFKRLWDKGLIYKGFKVVPYSTGLKTPISNFEAKLNYKEVKDKTAIVKFKLSTGEYALAWTTTPWTVPFNEALCVNPKGRFKRVTIGDEVFIQKGDEFPATDIIGLTYEKPYGGSGVVLSDSFVDNKSGTGIVHLAPAFGEDDLRVCTTVRIPIPDDLPTVDEVLTYLSEKNLLYKSGWITHKYPFCWRSDTRLIYKVTESWFLKVTAIKDQMLQALDETNWVPHDHRFRKWVEDARDWAISRTRNWGTPIPIWGNEVVTDLDLPDIHREFVDQVEINGHKRIPEVFDCWFESACIPFHRNSRATLVAEGLDQTRGWFYTLTVLSVALTGKSAFDNVIVSGLILDSTGKKMSKSKQNYTDPEEILDKYGAAALRLYLLGSPATRAEPLKFREADVKDIVRTVNIPWDNMKKFLRQIDGRQSSGVLDEWIVSKTNTTIKSMRQSMDEFRIQDAVITFKDFLREVSTVYINLTKKTLKPKVLEWVLGKLQEMANPLIGTGEGFPKAGETNPKLEQQVENLKTVNRLSKSCTLLKISHPTEDWIPKSLLGLIRGPEAVMFTSEIGDFRIEPNKRVLKRAWKSFSITREEALAQYPSDKFFLYQDGSTMEGLKLEFF